MSGCGRSSRGLERGQWSLGRRWTGHWGYRGRVTEGGAPASLEGGWEAERLGLGGAVEEVVRTGQGSLRGEGPGRAGPCG